MSRWSKRVLIGLAAGTAALGLVGCGSHHHAAATQPTVGPGPAPGSSTSAVPRTTTTTPRHATTTVHRPGATTTTIGAGATSTTSAPAMAGKGSSAVTNPAPQGGSSGPTTSRPTATATTRPSPVTTTTRPPAPTTTTTGPPATVDVAIGISSAPCNSLCYSPADITIAAGTTVIWTNDAQFAHTVTRCTAAACPPGPGSGAGPSFSSGDLAPGAPFSVTFTAPGTYNYYCTIHTYAVMHGTITVT
jgi:plastocyanin